MAEKDSNTDWKWLIDLIDRAFWPLDGYVNGLKEASATGVETHDNLLFFLVPLLECVKANLKVLEDVLSESLGDIRIECTERLRIFGAFHRDNFGKAYFKEPEKAQAAAGGE